MSALPPISNHSAQEASPRGVSAPGVAALAQRVRGSMSPPPGVAALARRVRGGVFPSGIVALTNAVSGLSAHTRFYL